MEKLIRSNNMPSANGITRNDLDTHTRIVRYGDFELTGAVLPDYGVEVRPQRGYRIETMEEHHPIPDGYKLDPDDYPRIVISETADKLYDLFTTLVTRLGDELDVGITSTFHSPQDPEKWVRECIDAPVLLSILEDFREELLIDGVTGICMQPHGCEDQVVDFSEHKLILVKSDELEDWMEVVADMQRWPAGEKTMITDAPHLHAMEKELYDRMHQLVARLSMIKH